MDQIRVWFKHCGWELEDNIVRSYFIHFNDQYMPINITIFFKTRPDAKLFKDRMNGMTPTYSTPGGHDNRIGADITVEYPLKVPLLKRLNVIGRPGAPPKIRVICKTLFWTYF